MIAQQAGSDILWFLYESDGTRVGFTYNGASYYYTKNAQGDVTGITDSNADLVVEYSYDAWGKLLSTTGSMAGTVGKTNPFLYRGYYYDAESGLYYLNSRYYDPQTGRFVSEDGQLNPDTGLAGNNLFAYCNSNPISMSDPSGARMLSQPGIETPEEQMEAAKYTSHKSSTHDDNRRPNTGEPGSTYKAPNGDTRTYGPNRLPLHDYDHNDHGYRDKHPHDENGGHNHDWDWSKTPPRQDPYILDRDPMAQFNLDDEAMLGIAGGAAFGSFGIGALGGLLLIFG